jgi:FtsP/CotA-like multicopper oxidase with cupredoxin domain
LIDSGWKDTVLVWPGERVKIAMNFGSYAGMYMYHCHILEHEDMTMMRNYMIMDPMMPEM